MKKIIAQYCCAALVAAGIGLNIQNATANYGITENKLALMAVGGSNSASGTIINPILPIVGSVISIVSQILADDSTNPKPDNNPRRFVCKPVYVTNHDYSDTGTDLPPSYQIGPHETYNTQKYKCKNAPASEATYYTYEECKNSHCED